MPHERRSTAADEDDDDHDNAENTERQADCQRYLVSVAGVALRERIEQVEPARTVTRALERRKPVLCRIPTAYSV